MFRRRVRRKGCGHQCHARQGLVRQFVGCWPSSQPVLGGWDRLQERTYPALHAVVFNDLTQETHTSAPLVHRHMCGIVQRFRHFGKIVGIDQNGTIAQLRSRTGEFADDKDATLVHLGRAEFLGHKVHSILEWSDQADVSSAIVSEKLIASKVAMEIMHWYPSRLGEFSIDLADKQLQFAAQMFVIGDILTAGDNHLHQCDVAAQLRIATQQEPVRLEPLRNALGVVQAVYSQYQHLFRKSLSDLGGTRFDFRTRRLLRKTFEIDANWKRAYYRPSSCHTHQWMRVAAFNTDLRQPAF